MREGSERASTDGGPAEAGANAQKGGLNPKAAVAGGAIALVLIVLLVRMFACSGTQSSEPVPQGDDSSAPSSQAVENDNLPVPDFAQLFQMNQEEAAEYLASYPNDDYYGNGEVPVDGGRFASSQAIADDVNWHYGESESGPGGWDMTLYWSDGGEACTDVYFQMAPLSGGDEELASSEAYAQMIEDYFADYGISEMTVAKQDYAAGRPDWSGGPYFYGYVIFDSGVVASLDGTVGTGYGISIYPSADSEGAPDFDEMKSVIANGYYEDVHSGGITYEIPIIDVYSTTAGGSESGSAGASDAGGDGTGEMPSSGNGEASLGHDIVTADFAFDIPEYWDDGDDWEISGTYEIDGESHTTWNAGSDNWTFVDTYEDENGSHAVVYPAVAMLSTDVHYLVRIDSVAADYPLNGGDYVTHNIGRIEDKGKTVDVMSVNWSARYAEQFFQHPNYSGPSEEEELMDMLVDLSSGGATTLFDVKVTATSASEMNEAIQPFQGMDVDFLTEEFVPTIEILG